MYLTTWFPPRWDYIVDFKFISFLVSDEFRNPNKDLIKFLLNAHYAAKQKTLFSKFSVYKVPKCQH